MKVRLRVYKDNDQSMRTRMRFSVYDTAVSSHVARTDIAAAADGVGRDGTIGWLAEQ